MKVLVISNLFPLPWEPGRGIFNAQQLRQLGRQHDIHVVVPVAWRQWWTHRRVARDSHDYHGITVTPVPYFYLPGIWRRSYAISMWLSLLVAQRRFRHWQADVVLATWLYPDAVAAAHLARQWHLPLLMKAHGSDVNVQCQVPARRQQVLAAADHASVVITVSHDLAAQLAQFGVSAEKLHTLYNGIDTERFSLADRTAARSALGISSADTVLLYIGNLKRSKGVLDLVEALRRLPADCWQRCVVIGDGEDRAAMQAAIAAAALSDKVELLGRLPHQQIGHWLAACDLLLLPSHAEGVPNVVLEAMACGRAVVASALPGIAEVLPEFAGVLALPQQPQAFADAIVSALGRHWDASSIHQHACRFSWQANAAALDTLLRQALSQHQHNGELDHD
jgi:glycosyltransferase involved in cell wall biosynthesis